MLVYSLQALHSVVNETQVDQLCKLIPFYKLWSSEKVRARMRVAALVKTWTSCD